MRTRLLSTLFGAVLTFFSVAAEAEGQFIDNGTAGLSGPATTYTFESAIAPGTAITTQYAGVRFTGVCQSSSPWLNTGRTLTNFDGACATGPVFSSFSMFFSSAVRGAAFQMVTNLGTSIFTAFLSGVRVASFSAVTDPPPPDAADWFGFRESVVLDEIRVTPAGTNRAMAMDNLQVGQAASVTPEPISMVLLGTGLVGVAAARRRRKQQAT